jgi:hypothetical protein
MSFTPADAGSRIFLKLFFANHTISLYLFDTDSDSDPDLPRPRYWCRDRDRYRDRFHVPEYRSVRIAGWVEVCLHVHKKSDNLVFKIASKLETVMRA